MLDVQQLLLERAQVLRDAIDIDTHRCIVGIGRGDTAQTQAGEQPCAGIAYQQLGKHSLQLTAVVDIGPLQIGLGGNRQGEIGLVLRL